MYTPLSPRKADFDMVRDLMIETGVLDQKIAFEDTPTRASPTAPASDRVEVPGGNRHRKIMQLYEATLYRIRTFASSGRIIPAKHVVACFKEQSHNRQGTASSHNRFA